MKTSVQSFARTEKACYTGIREKHFMPLLYRSMSGVSYWLIAEKAS